MIEISFVRSLPDTKLRKNIPQQIIRRNLARDLTEVMQGSADVNRQKVTRDVIFQSCQNGF